MALVPGLCSVTFRGLGAEAIVSLAAECKLRAIEWGADVHVPPGDVVVAGRVSQWCANEGMSCPSYGTYLWAGASDGRGLADLDAALDTADALGATTLRIWCRRGVEPQDASDEQWSRVADDVAIAADAAAGRGMTVALEHHPGTLTLTAASTLDLLERTGRRNARSYWQPLPGADPTSALAELESLLPVLAHLHVFSWERDSTRLPLADGEALWPNVFALAGDAADRVAYLEFVARDDPDQLRADALTLRRWLRA